ncbi:hypothetical protein AJ85_01830 [Alkalihalobacillus alcalophilus ATCC 27647 = CGMCC 1.3604]|uniref:DUF2529 domain-containing protein n=1 Tax=Alkalihalobacillus alcalophilus ATCC 27647 = CGMCC 1.3604 TaxID=1218173 RepID=A0A094XB60_ALKAL|nr:DUF2529 family protein [Alkalihalobacillus alcalophilus]KGA96040.1 hypothetical protein BALCAV_0218650 [Alkalihalobacillus alcalophilus ATCC 27647 = CGMCC 1.3604]MED1561017.1 DUF2529 family protein [Alkalihalobacillus alcalophilus]THG88627.1 hypothetical protein AJ85_01830 [Alkalihalobacillus alcalophilus ATCC 27647 = CGMCC 1.3604]
MIQIFTTQIQGLMKQIKDKQEEAIEDGARLLAQARVGSSSIYVHGTKEMGVIEQEALSGEDHLIHIKPLLCEEKVVSLDVNDRVLLASRYTTDPDAIKIAKDLKEKGIPFVAISTLKEVEATSEGLDTLADVFIHLNVKKPVVPLDDGTRTGYPASLIALYTYFCLALTLKEILSEVEDEL